MCVSVCSCVPSVSGCLSARPGAAAAVVGCVCAAARCVCVCRAAAVCIASVLPADSSSEIESPRPERPADPSANNDTKMKNLHDHLSVLTCVFTCVCYHGDALLLQRGGVDDPPQQAAVSDGVLLSFESFILQLTMDQ